MKLLWCTYGVGFLNNCLQILQEVFLKCLLSKYQLIVSEGATGVQRWDLHIEEISKSRYPHELKSSSCGTNVYSHPELKSFEEVNMNSKDIHTEGLPLFCMVSTKMLFLLHARYCRKTAIFAFNLYLSLFPSLSRTLCISIISLVVFGKMLYSLDTCHVFSSKNIAIIVLYCSL